jgi:hypothetical protein
MRGDREVTPRRVVAVVAVGAYAALAVVLTSCGASSGPQGYLYTAPGIVQFIQIVHNGPSVSGTEDAVVVVPIGPQTFHYTVTVPTTGAN